MLLGKLKSKPVLVFNMKKEYIRNGSMAPFIVSLGTGWNKWSTPHPSCFNPGKEPQCPLNRRLGELQSWCGCYGEGK